MQTDNLLNTLIVSPDAYLKHTLTTHLQGCNILSTGEPDVTGLETSLDILIFDAAQTGVKRLKQQRCLRCNAIIIVLGTGLDSEQRIDYLEAGADEVISLPINRDVLIAHINAVLRRARSGC